MNVPPEVIALFNGAAAFVAALLLGWAAEVALKFFKVDLDVSAAVPALAALLANLALAFFTGLVNQLPTSFVPVFYTILVAIIGGFAAFAYQRQRLELKAYRAAGPPKFKK